MRSRPYGKHAYAERTQYSNDSADISGLPRNEMKFSVIVPVYNAESTLTRCLDSLLEQEFSSFELLLINDGSTDGSGRICKEYAAKHNEIVYFEQPNRGASAARNLGLDNAKGRYIVFVDSDDYVLDGYFETLERYLDEKCQLLIFESEFEGVNLKSKCRRTLRGTADRNETVRFLVKALRKQQLNAVWNKVYLNDIIKKAHLRFDERLRVGEDKVFVVRYCQEVSCLLTIKDALYVMTFDSAESLTRKPREDLADNILLEHRLIFETIDNSELSDNQKRAYMAAAEYSFWRSAYTVAASLRRTQHIGKERSALTGDICKMYEAAGKERKHTLKNRILSIPVVHEMTRFIDCMVTVCCKINCR